MSEPAPALRRMHIDRRRCLARKNAIAALACALQFISRRGAEGEVGGDADGAAADPGDDRR